MPKDQHDELFWLVDEHDQPLGSVSRAEAHRDPSKIHRAVFILLTSPQGQVLLQKRSLLKDTNPGLWTVSASGHVEYLTEYDEAAHRELGEEIGVKTELIFHSKHLFSERNEQEYNVIYTGIIDHTPTQLDADEVTEVKWFDKEELAALAKQSLITPMGLRVLRVLGYL